MQILPQIIVDVYKNFVLKSLNNSVNWDLKNIIINTNSELIFLQVMYRCYVIYHKYFENINWPYHCSFGM